MTNEELIKKLRDLHRDPRPASAEWLFENQVALYDAAAAIEALEAKVPHWVSVKERLPNVGELVVGLDADGHAEITMLGESKCWLTYGLRIHNLGCYVWWMPLPEPPKEEEHGN